MINLKSRKIGVHSNLLTCSGIRPLLVEGDPNDLGALVSLLKYWGLNSYTASSLEEAIHSVQENHPNLIITNNHLPEEKTGIQLITTLEQKNNLVIPTILLTDKTHENILKQQNQSNYLLINKPVQATLLKATLLRLLTEVII